MATKKEFTVTIHAELGEFENGEGKHGPNVIKAQITDYGAKPGLNIQNFYTNADGELQYGKRPNLELNTLKWIRDEGIIDKAILLLESKEQAKEQVEEAAES